MLRDRFKKTTYIAIGGKSGKDERDEKGGKKENNKDKNSEDSIRIKEHRIPMVPEGLWIKCESCGQTIYRNDWTENLKICPKCGQYGRMTARERIAMLADESSFREWDETLEGKNPLHFPEYEKKLEKAKEATQLKEAVVTGEITIYGQRAAIAVCDAGFMMASMGEAVGEKITRAVEKATKLKFPVILYTASGGARMQEGMISLMQMAKTSAALKRHSKAGLLTIVVLTDPTTGGVTASFAMLGDIILAEPDALIGFAGPRVIEQTIGQKLPEGFQRAEFLLEHGFVDAIAARKEQKERLGRILRYHVKPNRPVHMGRDTICLEERDRQIQASRSTIHHRNVEGLKENPQSEMANNLKENLQSEMADDPIAEKRLFFQKKETRKIHKISAWERVQASRSIDRPTAMDYISRIFRGFLEFHGDRLFQDDPAVIGGIATIGRIPVTVIGQQKGKNTKENIYRNFGMSKPEGYRKALRLMKQAEKFGRPIICFVDTPGAFCGIEAEERGQGEAIARNLYEMADLKVPVLSILIGEAGSGGALALAVANEVWMMENATYSILSPEGFASILWKDSKKAKEAAEVMKITAQDLKELGIIDRIIPEYCDRKEEQIEAYAGYMKQAIKEFIKAYAEKSGEELEAQRYERFRNY